jgi:hypothetical protein
MPATTYPQYRTGTPHVIEGAALDPTTPIIAGRYYLADGKPVLATAADTTAGAFVINHSASKISFIDFSDRLGDRLPDGTHLFDGL